MKLFKILSHPYTLIISFCLIMISGEHLGGFYVLYILLGLPFGAIHSILAVGGIITILVTSYTFKSRNRFAQLANVIGVLLLLSSIYYFFWSDRQHYNYGSFEQTVPMMSMIFTAFIALCFLVGLFTKAPIKKPLLV